MSAPWSRWLIQVQTPKHDEIHKLVREQLPRQLHNRLSTAVLADYRDGHLVAVFRADTGKVFVCTLERGPRPELHYIIPKEFLAELCLKL